MKIYWRRTIVGGNSSVNPTYVWRSVLTALQRVATYKNVDFIQVSSGSAQLTIACVNYNIGKNVLMWTNGQTIYVPSTVNWGSWTDGMVGAMVHEIGHAFGSTSHNMTDAGIMRPSLQDPAQNFTQGDFRNWYTGLPAKPGAPAPWSEPNRWRKATAKALERPSHLDGFGFCHGNIWQRVLHMFDRHTVARIDE